MTYSGRWSGHVTINSRRSDLWELLDEDLTMLEVSGWDHGIDWKMLNCFPQGQCSFKSSQSYTLAHTCVVCTGQSALKGCAVVPQDTYQKSEHENDACVCVGESVKSSSSHPFASLSSYPSRMMPFNKHLSWQKPPAPLLSCSYHFVRFTISMWISKALSAAITEECARLLSDTTPRAIILKRFWFKK